MLNPEALLTAAQAAPRLGVTRNVIYRWVSLGYLKVAGRDSTGTRVFRLCDLWDAERETRQSPYSHRRVSAA